MSNQSNLVQFPTGTGNMQQTTQKPCSFHTVSATGKPLYGTSAMLRVMSQHGGPDAFINSCVHYGVEQAMQFALNMGNQSKSGGFLAKTHLLIGVFLYT